MVKRKWTKIDLQTTTQKTNDRATQTSLKQLVDIGDVEGLAIPAY